MMKSIVFSFMLLTFAVYCNADSINCQPDYLLEYNFINELDGSFRLHRGSVYLDEARQICEKEGAIVASPIDDKFFDFMQLALFKSGLETLRTGIHSEGFVSMEGISVKDMPECFANMDLAFNIVLLRDGTVQSVSTNNNHPFLCYKKDSNDTQDTTTTSPQIKSTYKFHAEGAIWSEANTICKGEGGYITIINSVEEAKIIKDIIIEHASATRRQYQEHEMGIFFYAEFYAWVTLDAKTRRMNKWPRGEPVRDDECETMDVKGELQPVNCSERHPFICEMET